MAKVRSDGLSPSNLPRGDDAELNLIIEFWNQLRVSDELGGTTWEVLEPLERRVTECLDRAPPDVDAARTATAEALWLLDGRSTF